ncbi:protease modulator HflC [Psychrosphaera sp. B3R10]|uniref:protease modulator HflC n=1 Tax=unclassified Psychrosphaera TaxID=2641570 RepID=UPI001C092008|nr:MULTISPECIES: protease modulator HflC [unclassified Psychrosphaera]MBU2882681.1 protease modulator HflC [Psychrosphaera sp. I2R16]MBU2989300.1 protease modulator HflC [Psychrosphaera sp. B3R10]MDO6718134.1 protease modulator HflC [Psychrosphaera sp. 1_MG-2023]
MKNFSIVALIFIGLMSFSSLFVVKEGQRAIVIQFGKVERDASGTTLVKEPGLHFKLPFVEKVRMIDARIQTLDDVPDRFVTAEKKDLIVDSFIKYRVSDFATYYLSTGGVKANAEQLLKQKVNNALRTEFGTRTIKEIVSGERTELMEAAIIAAKSSSDLGLEVLDVRVKQINLPLEVSNYIFERMRTERLKVAKAHRSEGREQAEIIRADVDARITIMIAEAEKNSQTLRGEGDAQAARVYADAFSKNAEFFSFVRSLDAYRNSFNSRQDIMVIEPDSDFFKYMKSTSGK